MDEVEIGFDSEVGGAVAQIEYGQYLELYDDANGLSSVVWSTDESAPDLIWHASDIFGDPGQDEEAVILFWTDGWGTETYRVEYMKAVDALYQTKLRMQDVAFCRIDHGPISLTWRALDLHSKAEGEVSHQASVVFTTGEITRIFAIVQATATPAVSKAAPSVLPELQQIARESTEPA
jgi:hypothetical protein